MICHDIKNLASLVNNLERREMEPKPAGESLIHRLKSLEVRVEDSGKRCETLQNNTHIAASQCLEYFQQRSEQFEKRAEEQMQRLETWMQRLEEDVRESVTANKKPLDDIEEDTEAKAAGNGLRMEGLKRQVTAIEKSQENLRVLLSELMDNQPSTGQNQKGGLIQPTRDRNGGSIQPTRILRPRKTIG